MSNHGWNLIISRVISLSDENGFVRSTTSNQGIHEIEHMLKRGMTRPLSATVPPYNKPMVPHAISVIFTGSAENPGLFYLIQNLDIIKENQIVISFEQLSKDAGSSHKRLWRASSDEFKEKNWEINHEPPPNTFISVIYLQILQGLRKLYQILYSLLILGPLAWLLSKEKRKKLGFS